MLPHFLRNLDRRTGGLEIWRATRRLPPKLDRRTGGLEILLSR